VDRFLFVLTRDLSADPSAAHVVRIAVATGRRQHPVTVFLAESAVCHDSLDDCRAVLERLRAAGAQLLAHRELLFEVGVTAEDLLLQEGDDVSLGDLLLIPGVRAHWC
jgi:hypothetical protein